MNYGSKLFWVTPSITSRAADMSPIIDRYAFLSRYFPNQVCALYSTLKDSEKQVSLSAFKSGEKRVLLGTSMIEVGLDISDVSICIIDGADFFGLSSLHQIRGRIGRGKPPANGLIQSNYI